MKVLMVAVSSESFRNLDAWVNIIYGTFTNHLFSNSIDTKDKETLGYGPDDRGSIPGRGNDGIFLVTASIPALGPAQLPNQWVPRLLITV